MSEKIKSVPAWFPLVMLLALPTPSFAREVDRAIDPNAAGAPIVEAGTPASMAFARYIAHLEETPWTSAAVEIEASLPKLEKHGRLRAIRRMLPFGKPEYQVLEIGGDKTVRQQVIARYLSEEVRAASIPASTLAITPANYRFRYQGFGRTRGIDAYIFHVTPHTKREGLINGELWIDAETGLAVRVSGYLVKRPSIFVKRVNMVRDTELRGGIAETRVTHWSLDTRLVGRAELTIQERPCILCESTEDSVDTLLPEFRQLPDSR
jgi:hypothetical protein